MFEIDWTTFHMQYLNKSTIYVKEYDSHWDFYTSDHNFTIYCRVMKKEDQAENFLFIERYLSGQSHIVKVEEIYGYEEIMQEKAPEEEIDPFEERLEEDLEEMREEENASDM